jgi:NADH dehydrogenase
VAEPSADEVSVTLVNAGDTFSERIRLHQMAAGKYGRRFPIKKLLGRRPVQFIQGMVTAIDLAERRVVVDDGAQTLDYDTLVYALGSRVGDGQIPGLKDHAYTLNPVGARATVALNQRLTEVAPSGGRLLVIGGGLTGIEGATELAERYPQLQVTLATGGKVGEGLSERGREHIRRVMDRLGITMLEGTTITQIDATTAYTNDSQSLDFDACLWAGPFTVPSLAGEAGLQVDSIGRVVVDDNLRSVSHPEVIAVGDAAFVQSQPLRMACATAMPTGAYAADHILTTVRNDIEQPFGFNYALQCISLGRRDALVQFVDTDDRPQDRTITGRFGALVKELICRYTIFSLVNERRFPGAYSYPKPKAPTVTPTYRRKKAL